MKTLYRTFTLSTGSFLSAFVLMACGESAPTDDGAANKPVVTELQAVKTAEGSLFKWPRSYEYMAPNAVLVFSGTTNWRHDSGIAGGLGFWTGEADRDGTGIFTTEHPGVFTAENLEKFSVIVLNSMTGSDVLNADQKAAVEKFVASGGGLILHHGSGDGSAAEDWPWFADLLGTKFISHPMAPQLQEARVVTLAPEHPVMEGLSEGFLHVDEWYTFDGPVKGKVTVLSGLDESSYSPVNTVYGDVSDLRMGPEPSDHPIIWAKCLGDTAGTGRVVYSALGHTVTSYTNPSHQKVLRQAMAWVRKDTDLEGRFCPQ
jgi:type 1 glutamine amidotransferase